MSAESNLCFYPSHDETFPAASFLETQRWARYIINYLYAISSDESKYSISEACDFTTSEYGLLTGYGFSATFVVAGKQHTRNPCCDGPTDSNSTQIAHLFFTVLTNSLDLHGLCF
jgi:hypothetical protein